ncbi:MAG: acetate--CoA ligase family protein [Thermoplasmata archaeon]
MSLDIIFNPKSICIIGASRDKGKVGNVILQNMSREFKGKIYLIHPVAQEINGIRCFRTVQDLPESPDIAVISLPPEKTIEYLEELGKKGCKVSIPVSGGFGEQGEKGKQLEMKIKNICEKYGMRVIGPNTVGVIVPRVGLNTALTEIDKTTFPRDGKVSFISQSGALGLLSMDAASDNGMGFSSFISLGNEADVTENDAYDLVSKDTGTQSIALYLEKISDTEDFLKKSRDISRTKGIVLMKGGQSEAGNRATSLHTGSLFKSNFSLRGIFNQHGIIQAFNETQLLDYALALAYGKPVMGDRIAIITSAGGVGVVSSDILENKGFRVSRPSKNLEERLRKIISPIASPFNPIDMTAEATDEQYEKLLKEIESSGEYDSIIVFALFQTAGVTEGLIDILRSFNEKGRIPFVVGVLGGEYTKNMIRKMLSLGIPTFPSIERATDGVWALRERGKFMRRFQK